MSRLNVAPLAVLAVGLVLLACDAAPVGSSRGVVQSAIQGGAVDRTHTFAVAILTGSELCSGALIAPNLVLTARHCVSAGGGDVIDCRTDTFAAPSSPDRFRVTTDATATDRSRAHRVAKILTPPAKKFCGNDIALLILDDVVDAAEAVPIVPAVEFPMTEHPRYGTEVAAIGYGITGPGRSDDGTRRLRQHIPIVCTPGDPLVPCSSLADYDITATEFVVEQGVCTGDSGGSAIEQASLADQPVTFGVLSRAAETTTSCTEATFTRTDAFKDFLVAGAEEAAAAGRYPTPKWAGGVDPGAIGSDDGGAPDGEVAGAPVAPTGYTTTAGCSSAPRPRDWPGVIGAAAACAVVGAGMARRRRAA